MTIDMVRRLVGNVRRKVQLMVTRGVVDRVNDALKCQGIQLTLLADEVSDDIEHFQEYGFTSRPFLGAEGLFLAVGGNRAHGIVACVTDRRYRPKNMAEGDVCLFTDKGERVYLERVADILHLGGGRSAADFVALDAKTRAEINKLVDDINELKAQVSAWTPVPNDGGAALKTNLLTWSGASLGSAASVAATKVKAT